LNVSDPVLCVDLDGTLIESDLLFESFLSAFKRSPWVCLQCIGWLVQGRARLKEELARRAVIDIATLPYRSEVVAFLKDERARGRRIILATASWSSLAEEVARHLGLFDEVHGTSRSGNLKGERKARLLVERWGAGGFDYVGDSTADIAVWRNARVAYVVGRAAYVQSALGGRAEIRDIPIGVSSPSRQPAALRALRVHQWAKNFLIFVPLLASHRVGDVSLAVLSVLAFLAFSLTASSAYLLNDLLDLSSDRAHPRKRNRPLASGQLSIPAGFALCAGTLAAGIIVAAFLPVLFQSTLAAYLALTLAYSFGLKRAAMLDVISLAGLYTLRIVAGGFAIGAPASFWLLAFAMFIFFSLALVKRYAELVSLEGEGIKAAPGRGYAGHDAEMILAIGSASAMVSALVLALYINGETVRDLYSRPAVLWLLCPVLLYWVSRIWLLAARGQMHDDPVVFALRDKASYIVATVGGLVVWAAT
jgi:4-hydroxybenzoate polyprenyltransferase/phosphoserine phosphatase